MPNSTRNSWATGLMVFAAALLVTVGIFQVLQALVALFNDEFLIVGPEYTYAFDISAWGWIHLVIGLGLGLVGWFLFSGAEWARWAGIALAVLSAVANFMWLPYYPFWSIVVIALNVAIIWALAVADVSGELD